MSELRALIAEAAALGGTNLCAAGHEWRTDGGRACPHDCGDSQPVYRCARCGEYDYGDPGGPAYRECELLDFNCGECANPTAARGSRVPDAG